MQVRSVLVIAAALLGAATAWTEDAVKKEQASLNGTWRFIQAEHDGHKSPPEKLKALKLVISADKITLHGDKGMDYNYKLDASHKPRRIDVTPCDGPDKGMVLQGIYELKGEELKLCLSKPGKERPTEFTSKENSGLVLILLKREK